MSKLLIFLSVWNLKPKLKPFCKLNMFLLNRAPDLVGALAVLDGALPRDAHAVDADLAHRRRAREARVPVRLPAVARRLGREE